MGNEMREASDIGGATRVFQIRRATVADAHALRNCLSDAFEPYRTQYTPQAFADTVPDLDGIERRLRTMTCFVATDENGDLAGTIAAQPVGTGEGHLRGMAVPERWQGSGVASLLLSTAENLLRDAGCTVISLDTTRPLERAIRFYERQGFAPTGRVQDFYGMPLYEYKKALSSDTPERRILILLFDGVEVLDFAGPSEVFSLATAAGGKKLCSVSTVAVTSEITCMGGLKVKADFALSDCPDADLLVVPGGPGARIPGEHHEQIAAFLATVKSRIPVIASVCTGSFLLARAKLLDGLEATTHPDRREQLQTEFPAIRLSSDKIVDRGSLITAGGISSGIDLGLYILEQWFGSACRTDVARRLDGAWA